MWYANAGVRKDGFSPRGADGVAARGAAATRTRFRCRRVFHASPPPPVGRSQLGEKPPGVGLFKPLYLRGVPSGATYTVPEIDTRDLNVDI